MNSYNHYAYGAVADWIYRYAAGIDTTPLDAGFHTIVLHPVFDPRLGGLEFSYQSSYGLISSGWTIREKSVAWSVTIPPNTTGRLDLRPGEAEHFLLDGVPLNKSKMVHAVTSEGGSRFEIPAGTYSFEIQLN
jgi:alpha-L-rhamnosidase